MDVRQYCVKGMIGTYAATDRDGTTTQGGYSTHVVVDADYAAHRQRFLAEQGYAYRIIDAGDLAAEA